MPVASRPTANLSASYLVAAIRSRLRRWQVSRWLLALAATAVLAGLVDHARQEAATARDQWGPREVVWVATRSLGAGEIMLSGDAAARELPVVAIPGDALATDPAGLQLRVDIAAGEVLRSARLNPLALGEIAARLPEGRVGLTLTVADDIFAVGDSAVIYSLATGRMLSSDTVVVATSDGGTTVGLSLSEASLVVGELARGGVTLALSR